MEAGTRIISKRSAQEDWGNRNDHSQLGEGGNETNEKEFRKNKGDLEI